MASRGDGWYDAIVDDARAGTRYGFIIDGGSMIVPDPASRRQPDGVHASSEIVVDDFAWPDDGWRNRPWPEIVIYELHVGTFTPEGTFLGAIEKLDHLARLGVTAIELMPVAQAPGTRNWGYDGAALYAPSSCYGTPNDLRRLIAQAHARDIAVLLDVVYNHFGPEGNYLHSYAPSFFSSRHQTPWGDAIDFTSSHADPVRAFFVENARYWIDEFHFDGLRLDAVHAIYDERPVTVLQEIERTIRREIDRPIHLIVEDDENLVRRFPRYIGHWNDDVHHALHVALTGEVDGYYVDYAADPIALLGRALTTGFAYQGERSVHRGGAPRGESSEECPLSFFVNFLQNHDQIGNRAFGERLDHLADDEAIRAALSVVLLAPSTPMLFMGEEWGATTPFLYFGDFEPGAAGTRCEKSNT